MEDVLTTLRDMLLNIQKTEDDAAQADKEGNGANKDTGDGECNCVFVGYSCCTLCCRGVMLCPLCWWKGCYVCVVLSTTTAVATAAAATAVYVRGCAIVQSGVAQTVCASTVL
jgi:hypothetical protein